jgi:Truncated hemoglobins
MKLGIPERRDVLGRKEIELLVSSFYQEVRADGLLGPVFDEVAKVDWDEHISKLCDFWETVLFRTGSYKGNPLAVHRHLAKDVEMGKMLFDRWLEIFVQTMDLHFRGENADHLKRVAADMAQVIHSRLQEVPSIQIRRVAS